MSFELQSPTHAQTDSDLITTLLMGFGNTQVLLTATDLGVFDTLTEASQTAEQIARRLSLPVDTLERLLIACAALGLLEKDGPLYALTGASRKHLVKNSPAYMGHGFSHFRHDLYPLWAHLAEAIRERQPQWGKIPGMSPEGPFESIYQDEAGVRSFMETMFSFSYPAALQYAETFDFGRFRHIVDVGGASGGFFAGVLPKFPQVRGTIFDLPVVGPVAREVMQRHGLGDRVDFVGGDFFKDPLPGGADLYSLGYILHDWNHEQGTQLLRKIYNALPDSGAVFISEALFNEQKDGPPMTAFMNLNMLVATYGQEHTPAEYEAWLKEAGFARTTHRYCHGPKSYVVGFKK